MSARASTDPLLELRGLSVALPEGADRPLAIDNVSFDIMPREILCIVGESGSGKSVTGQAIMGLLPKADLRIAAGAVLLGGQNILTTSDSEQRALRGKRVGMIFQEPMTALNPLMRIGAQIEEVLEIHTGMGKAQRRAVALDMIAAVGLPNPEDIRRSYPFRLSGGQRQRVVIAMALVLKPDLLIADEPTTALDVTTQKQILELIKTIQRDRQMAVMFITHDFGVVAEIADRVAVMQQGRVVEIGRAEDVLNRPQHPYTKQLIGSLPGGGAGRPLFVPRGDPLLAAEGIRKSFVLGGGFGRPSREVVAADDISLTIHPGETVGLVGESGSGKSTLARTAVGLIKPDGGRLFFKGTDLLRLDRRAFKPFRRDVQMVFQDPYASLNPRHRVGHIIAQGPVAFGEDPRKALARACELLELVGLPPAAASRYPHEFSGGQRQRISIARALAVNPALLIADEPVSALDASVQCQVLRLLADIRQRFNLAMLFITHDLRIAADICDTVGVMLRGRIVEYGPSAQVLSRPRDPYTQSLLDAVPGRGWSIPRDHAATPAVTG